MNWINDSHYYDEIEGVKIHYATNFKKEDLKEDEIVVVFNYGLVCNFAHFQYQYDYFDQRGFKILVHDYRCHFESVCDEISSCTFVNISHDLNQLLSYLGINKTFMIGHSMGVNVTLEYSRLYPEKLMAMVLISGTVFPPQDVMFDSNVVDLAEPYIQQARAQLGRIYEKLWSNMYKNPIAQFIVWQGGFNMSKTNISYVENYMKKIGELSPDLFFHLLTEMKQHDIIVDLEKLTTPALIIGGDKDKIIPNYLQRILKKYIKNSKLYIVKDGSHVPQVDFPESINERIINLFEHHMS
jgi:non-heme chloroperoxidase